MDSQIQILLGSDAAPFEDVINCLLSAHNESRAQAEHLLNACKQKYPGILLMKLVHILQHGSEPGSRSMAAVLLRKNIGLWLQLDKASRGEVKQQLLSCLVSEEVRSVWKLLCDTVAELASTVIYEDGWPELLPLLLQCGGSENFCLKEKALLVLGQYMPSATSEMHPHLDTIHEFFRQSLSLSMPGQVHLAALRAIASFTQSWDSPKQRYMFQDLLMPTMQALTSALEAHFDVVAQEELEVLIEVAGIAPGFLRAQLHEVLGFMIKIVEAQGLEDGTRDLALEFFLTLAETRGFATGVMRKLPRLVARLFVFLLNLLVDVEDTALWYAADTKDLNAGLSTNFETGKEGLDRLSYSLGGKIILPIASEVVPSYLNDIDWRKRHAALIALSQIAEGCQKVMIESLDSVVDMVLVSFSDPHIRVRWAAISAISQLCIDFSSEPMEHFHQKIAPALIDALGDFQNARVQAHAAAAIANFCRGCTAEVLKPWLGGLTEKLLLLLQNGKLMQQEVALMALAAVAYSAQSLFRVYYDAVIPYLKHILCNATDSEDRMLRAKSLECISVIGLAVGKDKFSHDVKEVSDVLKGLQTSVLNDNDDDPTACYMLQAWARICKCLGKDFLPYIGVVMPPLLQMVQLNPGVTVTDANALFEQVTPCDHDRNGRTTITIGNKRIGVNINMLEDKATACNVLSCIVDELKEGFYPWLDQVLPILVSLLNFSFHEVRMAAVSAMPQLLHVGKSAVGKGLAQGRDASFVKELSDYIIASFVKALHKEHLVEVLTKMLGSLDESIQISWTILEAGQVQDVVDVLKYVIIASISRRREMLERRTLEVFDEEEFELLKEEDAEETAVFEQVGKCFGTLAKLQKSAFAPYFNELVPFITRMLEKDWTLDEKYIAICIFNDVAENCGASAIRYHGMFLPFLLEASMDADADVCQAAVYGIGVCAKHGDARSKPFVEEALRRLYYIINHRSVLKFDNRMATDNAISALGKICEYQRDCINAAQVLPAWLSCLPIRNDLREAKVLHGIFFRMVARSDALLLGQKNQNLPKILSVFAEILTAEGDLAYEEMLAEIPDLLQKIKQAMPPTAFASLWASLPAQHQEVLHPIFKT